MDDADRPPTPPAPLEPPDAPAEPDRRARDDHDDGEPPKVTQEDVSRLSPEHAPDDV